MARSWFVPPRVREAAPPAPARVVEALADQVIAAGGGYGYGAGGLDPIDDDRGYRPVSHGPRQVPYWTRERARTFSVTAFRSNPMARAIIDTYTSFCVGDSGLSLTSPVPVVRDYAERQWRDPKNRLDSQERQRLFLGDHLLMGETALELMSGNLNGVTRISPIDTDRISDVTVDKGNALWPDKLWLRAGPGDLKPLTVMRPDDITGRRDGQVAWWVSFRALLRDQRGDPFLMPVLDDLDAYAQVISNLIDRTALMRHIAFDVTVKGDQSAVDDFIARRGGHHVPRSGTIEAHNESVTWTPMSANVGSEEDKTTAATILTSVSAGTGLAKTWLAEPEGANRATSLSMAEPVRRRVGGVQACWLEYQNDLIRYMVDQGVRTGAVPIMVDAPDGNGASQIPASMSVSIGGPEVAAADAQVTAQILVNLSRALVQLRSQNLLSKEAAQMAAQKGWEQFCGVPYTSDLDGPDVEPDEIATLIDDNPPDGMTPAQTLQGAPL